MTKSMFVIAAAMAAFLFGMPGAYAFGTGGGQAQMPEGHPATGGPSGPTIVDSDGSDIMAGEVVETLQAGGYTYVKIKNEGGEGWVAIPKQEVTVGEHMVFSPGDTMYDFESKTLKRKFDVIVFSPGPLHLPGTEVEKSMRRKDPSAKSEKIEAAKGDNAHTVRDVYVQRLVLDKKTVKVRGKVVKVSRNIMKTNWVHIQDGTGSAGEGDNNLVVTTDDVAKVGDVVTVTGKVAANRDFGYGYKYDVIIEGAEISAK